MDITKLHMRIGEHEFEAEGPAEIVREQFQAFKELVASFPNDSQRTVEQSTDSGQVENDRGLLEKIAQLDGKTVSLTVPAGSIQDAALLILFGQREFRGDNRVTGGQIMDGLRESGQTVPRVDHTLDKLATAGHVIRSGTGRARRYRLTNTGISQARDVAQTINSNIPD